jgi:hypothetical protein
VAMGRQACQLSRCRGAYRLPAEASALLLRTSIGYTAHHASTPATPPATKLEAANGLDNLARVRHQNRRQSYIAVAVAPQSSRWEGLPGETTLFGDWAHRVPCELVWAS